MLAKHIMTRSVVSVTPDSGVLHAAQLMLENHVSGLTVIDDGGKLVGVLTEGDLLARAELGTAASQSGNQPDGDAAAMQYIRSNSWRVQDLMTKDVVTAEETTPVDRLAATMAGSKIKRLPIMRGERVVGVVSRADVLRTLLDVPRGSNAQGDAAIRRAVSTRLYSDLQLDSAVTFVSASDGNVRLWGHVASEIVSRAAAVAAETVEGVRGVINDLQISGTRR